MHFDGNLVRLIGGQTCESDPRTESTEAKFREVGMKQSVNVASSVAQNAFLTGIRPTEVPEMFLSTSRIFRFPVRVAGAR